MGQHETEPEPFAQLDRQFERSATLLGVGDAADHGSAHCSPLHSKFDCRVARKRAAAIGRRPHFGWTPARAVPDGRSNLAKWARGPMAASTRARPSSKGCSRYANPRYRESMPNRADATFDRLLQGSTGYRVDGPEGYLGVVEGVPFAGNPPRPLVLVVGGAQAFVSFPCGAWRSYCQTLVASSSGRARSAVNTHERIRDRPRRASARLVGHGGGRVCMAGCPGERRGVRTPDDGLESAQNGAGTS